MPAPIPVVLDTDIGSDPDDALALILALASPELDLLGVTVVDGDVDLRARIAARLLGLAGRPDIPVFKGGSRPLGPGCGPTMHGHEGRGILDHDHAGPDAPIADTPASEWLVAAARRRPFHLVGIGPCANLARALRLDPDLTGRRPGFSAMGGVFAPRGFAAGWRHAFRTTGRRPAALDRNTASDPQAALICARAGPPVTWITAEMTCRVPLHRAAQHRLAAAGGPLAAALDRARAIWRDDWLRTTVPPTTGPALVPPDGVAFLHDPLTVAALFPGAWLTLRDARLAYAIEGGLFRLRPASDGRVARASVAVDGAAFERFFVDRVGRCLARRSGPPAHAE